MSAASGRAESQAPSGGGGADPKRSDERYFFLFALRTFRRLLASFALPLLLPLVVSFSVYLAAIASINTEIGKANESALLLMKRIVDARLNESAATADQLSVNADVQSAAAARPPVSPNQRLLMANVQGLLRQCALANPFIESIYLYLPQSGYVLSNVSRYRGDEFDMTAREKFGMGTEEWKRTLLSSGYRRYRILDSADPEVADSIVFSQKLVFENAGATPAVAVIRTDRRRFIELLDSFKWNEDAFLSVLSPDSSVAARSSTPSRMPAELSYAAVPEGYRSALSGKGDRRFFISTVGSAVSDWRYAYVVPSGTYSRSADFVKRIMIAYVVTCLIGGFALSLFLARREYTPIRRLSRIFLDRLGGAEPGAGGDFSYLEDALRGLLREHENLEDLIRRQNGTVRSGLLARLLQGNVPQLDVLLESCAACGIVFPSGRCLVMAVSVCGGREPMEGAEAPTETDTGALVRYMLQPVLDELWGTRAAAYVTETAGGIRCVVVPSPDEASDRFIEETKRLAERVRTLFAERFGLGLSFAVSRMHDSPSALPLAAAEADEIMESIILYDRKDVTVCAGDAASDPGRSAAVHSSLALHRTIAESAYAGDFAAVRESVSRFADAELLKADLPLQTAKLRVSGIVNIVMEALQELRPAFESAFIDELNPMERLSRVKSLTELKRQVEEIFLCLEAKWPAKAHDQPSVLKDEVVRYVEENFRDCNLNVNAVADAFSVSVPHLSRTFKKATGIGLLDYLHLVRVKEAKRLMKENRFGIGEIAVMAGFGSRVTLARAFKRYEGIAPSAFRESEDKRLS